MFKSLLDWISRRKRLRNYLKNNPSFKKSNLNLYDVRGYRYDAKANKWERVND